ncbi:MAG: cupredoxin family copper-binding protein [Mycobacteriales bacterium]
MPVVVAAAAAALIGCSGGVAYRGSTSAASAPAPTAAASSSATASAVSASGGDVTVDIANYKFQTPAVSVKIGSTVTWVNKDDFDHTATATDKTFDTKKLAKGATGKVTFDTAGTFNYVCDIHQYMTGTVVVT